jgi:peptide/nickel transport system permease protein
LRDFIWENPSIAFGTVLGLVIAVAVVFGPVTIAHDPNAITVANRFAAVTSKDPFGTDELGRDTLTRLLYGGRTSLVIAILSASLGTVLALIVGLIAGFTGRWVDVVVMRVVDLFFAIPTILLAIGIVALFGASAKTVIVALGIAYTPFYARLVRGAVVSVRSRTYVDASRVLGSKGLRLLRADILPGVLPIAIVQSTVLLGYALVDEASLGFLGLGVQPPDASWGAMINDGRQFIFEDPWLTIIPGVAVIATVLAINLASDGLRDAFDPRASQRQREQV